MFIDNLLRVTVAVFVVVYKCVMAAMQSVEWQWRCWVGCRSCTATLSPLALRCYTLDAPKPRMVHQDCVFVCLFPGDSWRDLPSRKDTCLTTGVMQVADKLCIAQVPHNIPRLGQPPASLCNDKTPFSETIMRLFQDGLMGLSESVSSSERCPSCSLPLSLSK